MIEKRLSPRETRRWQKFAGRFSPTMLMRGPVVIGLLAGIAVLFIVDEFTAQDLMTYREAGVALWEGRNPYALPETARYVTKGRFGLSALEALQIWTPPTALFVPLILGLFSPWGAKVVWLGALWLCLVAAMRLLRRERPNTQGFITIGASLVILGAPLINGLFWGSVAPFEALPYFLLVLFLSDSRERPVFSAVPLFFMSFKPQLALAPLCRYAAIAVRHRSFLLSVGIALVLSFSFLAVLLTMRPSVNAEFLGTDRSVFFGHASFTVTLPTLLGAQPWVNLPRYLLLLAVCLMVAWYWCSVTDRLSPGRQLVEFSPLTFLFIPYCWAHDYIILLPWLMLFIHDVRATRSGIDRYLFFGGALLWFLGEIILLRRETAGGHFYAKFVLLPGLCIWLFVRYRQLRRESCLGGVLS